LKLASYGHDSSVSVNRNPVAGRNLSNQIANAGNSRDAHIAGNYEHVRGPAPLFRNDCGWRRLAEPNERRWSKVSSNDYAVRGDAALVRVRIRKLPEKPVADVLDIPRSLAQPFVCSILLPANQTLADRPYRPFGVDPIFGDKFADGIDERRTFKHHQMRLENFAYYGARRVRNEALEIAPAGLYSEIESAYFGLRLFRCEVPAEILPSSAVQQNRAAGGNTARHTSSLQDE
jgi:hypothetical protein